MNLNEAIAAADKRDQLGLILYAIPGFPTTAAYAEIDHILCGDPDVSVIETTLPVRSRFSSHANATIRRAHRTAAQNLTAEAADGWQLQAANRTKPRLCVLYREAARVMGLDGAIQSLSGSVSDLLISVDRPLGVLECFLVVAKGLA